MNKSYPILITILLLFSLYVTAAVRTSAQSGNWNNAATWEGGSVPGASDDVIITAGHTVTTTNAAASAKLEVFGTFMYSTSGNLTINGDLVIQSSGVVNVFANATTGRTLIIKGNLINNGKIDASKGTSVITMAEPLNRQGTIISGGGDFDVIRTLNIQNKSGVTLNVAISVCNNLRLLNGVFYNASNLTLDNKDFGSGPSAASQIIITRSQEGSLDKPYTLGSSAALFVQYTANATGSPLQIVAGYEIPAPASGSASSSIARLTVDNSEGLVLSDNLTLTSSSTALILTSGVVTLPAGKALTITNTTVGATLIGEGTATSYVDGAIIVSASASTPQIRNIPIGYAGNNRKVVISGLKAAGSVNVAVKFYIEPSTIGATADGITLSNTCRWVGEVVSGELDSYTGISIDYHSDNNIDETVPPNIIAKSQTATGLYSSMGMGNSTATSINSANGIFKEFGYFSLAFNGTLPVELSSFSVKSENSKARIVWSTQSESNNKEFIIERSLDGETFSYLATIPGKGTYQGITNYLAYDQFPASGTNYYRLSQIDYNGRTTVYPVKAQIFDFEKDLTVLVYPNPVSEKINIRLANSRTQKADVSLLDANGTLRFRASNVDIQNGYQITNLSNLAKGIYIIQVKGSGFSKSKTVVVN